MCHDIQITKKNMYELDRSKVQWMQFYSDGDSYHENNCLGARQQH